ncbi:MAG: hypothetical protein J6W09_07810 [Bacteroidales bacterium]|nr:hypothetical protein [Bacteroidales bacterium]
MKKTYFTPLLEVEQVRVERNFTASPWYQKGGQGNFTYIVEEEDEFE